MNKKIWIYLLIMTLCVLGKAQNFDESSFLQNLKSSYYLLAQRPVKNFIVQINSAKIDAFTKENWDTTGIPVIQLIWQNPADVYLSEIRFPYKMNDNQQKEYRELLEALKVQIRGILLDLQRFYITGLLNDDLINKFVLRHNEQAVQMTFKNFDQQGTTIKYLLGLNALCILIDVEYPDQSKRMVIYPEFNLVDAKWLCMGWTVQTMISDQVVSGFKVTIKYNKLQDIYLPYSFFIEVQKIEEKDKIFYDEVRFFNYRLNQKIEIKK